MIYSAGLRDQEAINLKISDIDFEGKTIQVRQSKFKKDRILPLSDLMANGLSKYLAAEHPQTWLFDGKEPGGRCLAPHSLDNFKFGLSFGESTQHSHSMPCRTSHFG